MLPRETVKCDATCPTCGLYWTREGNEDCPRCDTCSRLTIEQQEFAENHGADWKLLGAMLTDRNRCGACGRPIEAAQLKKGICAECWDAE